MLEIFWFLVDWLLSFFSLARINKLPKSVAVATCDLSAEKSILAFFATFPDIEKIQVFVSGRGNRAVVDKLDLLIIHDARAHANFLSIPDFVPREVLSYAELVPVASLRDTALRQALVNFSAKSQRFGR